MQGLLWLVAASLDASRQVVLDHVGPVVAGVHGGGGRLLAWSDGLGCVKHTGKVDTSLSSFEYTTKC